MSSTCSTDAVLPPVLDLAGARAQTATVDAPSGSLERASIGDDLVAAGRGATRCRRCGEPTTSADQVISSHPISTGRVTYVRCPCGGVGLVVEEWRAA